MSSPESAPESRDDPNTRLFWESRYLGGDAGWDIGKPAPPFVDLLAQPDAPPPGNIIVLGCGRGHDAIFFAQHGFEVTAVDFAPSAIADARQTAERAGVNINFVEHDLFTLDESYDHKFAYVLEHTCFAAIYPKRRQEYERLVSRLIAPNGLYIALFFAHSKWGGPPFSTNGEEIRALFDPDFIIEKLEPPRHSVQQRQGEELFALMRPR